jgi:hypothetical protein
MYRPARIAVAVPDATDGGPGLESLHFVTEPAQLMELVEVGESGPTTSTSNPSTAFPGALFGSCIALIWKFLPGCLSYELSRRLEKWT